MKPKGSELIKFQGIYGVEILNCGCQIKRYGLGGKVIIVGFAKCTNLIKCRTKIKFVCGICGLNFSKKKLKEHQWNHAI